MPKVIHVTVMLEVTDETPPPEEWDWHEWMTPVPGVRGFSLLTMENRPYDCMEDDPCGHTKH